MPVVLANGFGGCVPEACGHDWKRITSLEDQRVGRKLGHTGRDARFRLRRRATPGLWGVGCDDRDRGQKTPSIEAGTHGLLTTVRDNIWSALTGTGAARDFATSPIPA